MAREEVEVAFFMCGFDSSRTMRLGVFDDDAVEVTQHGQCSALAYAVAEALGLSTILAAFVHHGDQEEPRLLHALVEHPSQFGMLIDSHGSQSIAEVEADFESHYPGDWFWQEMSLEEVLACNGEISHSMLPQNFEFARSIVEPVLALAGADHLIVSNQKS